MKNGYTTNINFKIAFTGMMLALTILFQYLEKFTPFAMGLMNINLSIIFIIATSYVVGFKWAVLLLVLRFALGPAVGTTGYSLIGLWSHSILLFSGSTFLGLIHLFNKIIFKKMSEKKNLLLTAVATVLVSTIVMTVLNAVLFTPVFFYILKYVQAPTISNAIGVYPPALFFGIPNYWGGIAVIFGVGNLVKFSIAIILFIPIWKITKHYKK